MLPENGSTESQYYFILKHNRRIIKQMPNVSFKLHYHKSHTQEISRWRTENLSLQLNRLVYFETSFKKIDPVVFAQSNFKTDGE